MNIARPLQKIGVLVVAVCYTLFVLANTAPVLAASTNLIANPSLETISGTSPASWLTGKWGTNTTSFSYLTSGHTGSRSVKVTVSRYTSGDAKWYPKPAAIQAKTSYNYADYYQASVPTTFVAQFTSTSGGLSYQTLGNVAAAATWTKAAYTFTTPATASKITIFHLIGRVGWLQIDDASLIQTVVASAPTISITAPSSNATLSGSATLSATAAAPQGIKQVQFSIDGTTLGTAIVAPPYQTTWDTTNVSDGSHTLSATATASDGQTTTTSPLPISVQNNIPTSNSITNGSFEMPDPDNAALPLGWNNSGWGSNVRSFSYLNTGHSGTKSVKATISSFSNGSAYWTTDSIPVTGGQLYDFSDYYQSSTLSEIDLTFTMSDGSFVYQYAGEGSPSPNSWTKLRTQFTAPIGAVSVNIYHDIFSVGWVTIDDLSLTPFTYQGFSRPIISITDDDGYASFYNNGLPLLKKYGFASTDYIITGSLNNDPNYMTSAMVQALYASGQEIGSHTVTHPDLTTISPTAMDSELQTSQSFLQQLLGTPVANFASPYGAYNNQIVTDALQYYRSYRGTESGYNARNNFDIGHLMVQNLVSTTTIAEVQSWINEAKSTNTWLILVYHQINPDTSAGDYNTYPSDFDAQLSAIKASGISVETVNQALNEIMPQL